MPLRWREAPGPDGRGLTWRLGIWVGWCLGFAAGFALAGWLFANLLAAHAQSADVEAALHGAATTYGASEACLRAIAFRESRYQPEAVGRWVFVRGYGWDRARGLMQYMTPTWATLSRWAGFAGADVHDPWPAAYVAAWTLTHPWSGGVNHWRGC